MQIFNNLLYSGHIFSEDENLEKFRFLLVNILMLINMLFTLLGILSSLFGDASYSALFISILSLYFIFSIYIFFLLRKRKKYYYLAAMSLLSGMMVLFFNVLFVHTEDEFRLIAFFFLLLVTYALLGKKYGLALGVFLYLSMRIIIGFYDIQLSEHALRTFFVFLFSFTLFLYFFMNKVEKDAHEFKVLNQKLEEKVEKEVLQRQEQEEMLLRQCRMANMGEMIDAIAHQWRQPLMNINAILMNMDILTDEEKKDSRVLENRIDEIASLTSHMSQTIEDFRTLYQDEKEKTNVNLCALIEDVMLLMKNNFQDISVSISCGDTVTILSYKNELTQVLITLFSNAIEVMKNRHIFPKEMVIEVHKDDTHTVISVEDNAGGIIEKNIAVIFDPYFTTKKQIGGTGLGLYITKIIVEDHMKGMMRVINTKKGAKFFIRLPHEDMI